MAEVQGGEKTAGAGCVWAVHRAPIGPLLLAATERGLVLVAFHADARTVELRLEELRAALDGPPVARAEAAAGPAADHLDAAAAELASYFAGRLRSFGVPLDWSLVGGYQRRALQELAASVPYGCTAEYGELARRTGEPGAARAVGAAMGANPLPLVVPCHRVVASAGGIGGFGGGLETKRELLALEGVLPEPLF
ncbi:methylated-DNA--[protein]-cysteine S-methyltransferase [Streptomyces xiaopingdaonensis]|uniref:methylated-DNA--[protein]-cysteine S-methyltransferase n=1 Tax=Streptomyces xiaopingdaonensis TaxID=1565415 RepID=UPI00030E2185|nr:methylated-DNA--[protein]-cysteine S-methyltransferase [Streptomyces xiaopingdaonensis]